MAEPTLDEVRSMHRAAAEMVVLNPVLSPVFERFEIELLEAEAAAAQDPIARARRRIEAERMRG